MSKPVVGMGIAVLIVFMPLIDGGTSHIPWTVARIMALGLMYGVISMLVSREMLKIRWSLFIIPIALCVFLCGIWQFRASNSWAALQWSMNYSSYLAIFIASAYAFQSNSGKLGRSHWILIIGLALSVLFQAGWGVTHLEGGLLKARGTFVNTSYYGVFMSISASFFVAMALNTREEKKIFGEIGRLNFLYLFFGIFCSMGAALSASRAAVLALLAGLFVAFWTRFRAKATLIVIVTVILLMITPNPFSKRLKVLSLDIYAWQRLNIYKSTIMLIKDHPFGIGQGNYQFWITGYGFPVEQAFGKYGKSPRWAHSTYFQLSAELGPIAGISCLLIVGFLILKGLKVNARQRGSAAIFAGSAAAGLSTWAVASAVDTSIVSPPVTLLACIMGGIIYSSKPFQEDKVPLTLEIKLYPRFKVYASFIGILLAILVLSSLAGWLLKQEATKRLKEGKMKEAGAYYEKAMKVDRLNPSYPYRLSGIAFSNFKKTGDVEFAKRTFMLLESAISLSPQSAIYHIRLADSILESSAYADDPEQARKDAIPLYKHAISISPTQVFYINKLAIAFYRTNDFDNAIKYYRKALSLEPDFAMVRLNLVKILVEVGKKAEAIEQLKFIKETLAEANGRRNKLSEYELGLVDVSVNEIEALEKLTQE